MNRKSTPTGMLYGTIIASAIYAASTPFLNYAVESSSRIPETQVVQIKKEQKTKGHVRSLEEKIIEEEVKKISRGLNEIGRFNINTPKRREVFYGRTNVPGIKVIEYSDGKPLEIKGKASFYYPGSNKDPYSGGDSAAVGIKFARFDEQEIVTVAGSDRFLKMGDYIEIENPKNERKTCALVVDRFAEWLIEKRPDRVIDIRLDTPVKDKLDLVYGVPKISVRRIGRFNYNKSDEKWGFERYQS